MKKSLYDLLRVPRDASNDEIKEAYAKQVARLPSEASSSEATDHSKFYKDAYDILSNPVRRKQYDESLAEKAEPQVIFVEENSGLDLKVVALIGILVLAGGWYYLDHSREMERLKIERATQLIHEQQALEKERLEQQALAEQTRLGFTKQNMDQHQAILERQERQQDSRYFDQLRQQEENAERRKKSEEEQNLRKEQREAEQQRRQAENDLAKQKAWVERAERERYGYRR
jgi:curved DNA-binding protein CbpA